MIAPRAKLCGRVVELLSQTKFTQGQVWEDNLATLEASRMRAQWTRAWLIAPFGAPTFWDHSTRFTEAMLRDKERRLAKLAVWFQAEKTRANPLVLDRRIGAGDLARRDIVRLADAFAWPSDFASWGRFCTWAIRSITEFPINTIRDVVSAFEVWQNMLADVPNAVSVQIIRTITQWLEDIEEREYPEEFRYNPGPWSELERGGVEELQQRLRTLLLRVARTERDRVRAYLNRVLAWERLRGHAVGQILQFTPTLAAHHAKEVVAIALAEIKGELPAEEAARPIERGVFSHSFSYHDWHRLAIDDSVESYYPPSPLREPFDSLFGAAPQEALGLVREIANHAITAWRQLFNFDREQRATPIPVALDFPWGRQEFWGNGQEYVWPRGHNAPNPVMCGLMALEHWAFREVGGGRPVDDVIRDVVDGHQSCAVLSIAVSVALQARRVSAATLPLVTSQRIWTWDIARHASESDVDSNLIGFRDASDRKHMEAVRAANQRERRAMDVRWLAQLFVVSNNDELRTNAQTAIKAFVTDLPYDYEEDKQDVEHTASLRRTAEIWSEWGKLENYVATPAPDGSGTYIRVENPTAFDPDVVEVIQRTVRMNDQIKLLNWVWDSLKTERISDKLPLSEAVERAKRIQRPGLFAELHGEVNDASMDRSAVAGVGAVVLLCGGNVDTSDRNWAKTIVFEAHATPEKRDRRGWFAGSKHLHHPCLFAVSGLEGLVRQGVDVREAERGLLRLAGHPLEEVSEKAIGAALSLWQVDARFAWAALNLGVRISTGSKRVRPSAFGYDHTTEPDRMDVAVDAAIQELESSELSASLLAVPPAWVFAPRAPRGDVIDDDAGIREPVWRDPDEFLRWDFLPKVLARIPIPLVMADELRRPAFLSFAYDLLKWTNERLNPSWRKSVSSRRERRATELLEWRRHFCWFLAKLAMELKPEEVRRSILDPIFAHDDEIAASLISPLADILAAGGIIDPPVISTDVVGYMQLCLQRILKDRVWENARRRDGNLYGFDLPEIVRIFLFATGVRANGAARFANGNWQDIGGVLPIVDPFVRAVGDVPHVMSSFLTLCESAIEHYPPKTFAEQVLSVLEKQTGIPVGWRGTVIPGRIAALVHALAERSQPLPLTLAQAMLRILDRLVDMGDRRSAALQTSEIFKDIRV
jgi:hypothetical protein